MDEEAKTREDAKVICALVVIAALGVCAFVWIISNGLSAQITEVKNAVLKNSDAIAQLKASGSAAGSSGGVNATPTSGLPKGISRIASGTSCAASSGKPKVFFFTDPYCPACAATERYVNAFVDEFSNFTDIAYRTVVTHSGGMIRKYGEDNVTLAHKYFVCVQEQGLGKIQKFKELFYSNLKDDGTDYIPFNATQLAYFAEQAGADSAKIASCLAGAKAKMEKDVQDALRFGGGTYSTPTMVLDCLYTGHSGYASNAVCFAYPNLAPCKK
ncbi:MAG: thioredoxin domain-containing protein [Candidatus Norongarragalinales archaeon]